LVNQRYHLGYQELLGIDLALNLDHSFHFLASKHLNLLQVF
jgi:hypothetical protein